MKVIVLLKPQLSAGAVSYKRKLQISSEEKFLSADDVAAIDAALALKEEKQAAVTAVAFGDESCDIILREAVARGADEAILVQGAEDIRNAAAAAAALKKVIAAEKADKILMGSRSGNHFQKTAGELLTALMPVDVITAGEGSVGHMYAGRVFEVYANDCVRTADAGLEEKAFPAVGYENCKRARMQKKVTGTPEEAADAIAAFLEEIDFRKDRGTGRAAVLTCGNGSFTFVPATEEGIAFAAGLAQKEKLPVLGGCVDAAIRDGKMQISVPLENRYVREVIEPAGDAVILYDNFALAAALKNAAQGGDCGFKELKGSLGRLPGDTVIAAGGRGMCTKEAFDKLQTIADKLGGTVAASRAAVFNGWAGEDVQVGISGRTVAPKLYIAFGISGAMQHVDGFSGSDYVISVNVNDTAPINEETYLIAVGDAEQTVDALIKKLG